MRFLVDANLPRSACDLFRRFGHEAVHVADALAHDTADPAIADFARAWPGCLVTRDYGFADVRAYPPANYHGIVVLDLPCTATAAMILSLLEALLNQRDIMGQLPGRLAIVEFGRVRLRGGG